MEYCTEKRLYGLFPPHAGTTLFNLSCPFIYLIPLFSASFFMYPLMDGLQILLKKRKNV
jgi:hypothetical protein